MDPARIGQWSVISSAMDRMSSGRVVIAPEGRRHRYRIGWPLGRGSAVRDAKRKEVLSVLDHEAGACLVVLVSSGQDDDAGDEYPWPAAVDATLFSLAAHRPVERVLTEGERRRQYSETVMEHVLCLLEHVQKRLTVSEVCEGLGRHGVQYQSVLVEDTLSVGRDRGEVGYATDVWGRGYGLVDWGGDEED